MFLRKYVLWMAIGRTQSLYVDMPDIVSAGVSMVEVKKDADAGKKEVILRNK